VKVESFDAVGGPEAEDELLHSEDDKADKNDGEHEEACVVLTADVDDDNDEFVEWNEGDGNVP